MSKAYNVRPSALIDVEDEYTAFCFDEACDEIMNRLNNGEKPTFHSHYSKFSDFYKQFD